MDGSDPLVSEDKTTEAERLEQEKKLRLNPHELGSEVARDLSDDMRGDKITGTEHIDTVRTTVTDSNN